MNDGELTFGTPVTYGHLYRRYVLHGTRWSCVVARGNRGRYEGADPRGAVFHDADITHGKLAFHPDSPGRDYPAPVGWQGRSVQVDPVRYLRAEAWEFDLERFKATRDGWATVTHAGLYLSPVRVTEGAVGRDWNEGEGHRWFAQRSLTLHEVARRMPSGGRVVIDLVDCADLTPVQTSSVLG